MGTKAVRVPLYRSENTLTVRRAAYLSSGELPKPWSDSHSPCNLVCVFFKFYFELICTGDFLESGSWSANLRERTAVMSGNIQISPSVCGGKTRGAPGRSCFLTTFDRALGATQCESYVRPEKNAFSDLKGIVLVRACYLGLSCITPSKLRRMDRIKLFPRLP